MRAPCLRRVSPPSALVAACFGVFLGLLTFAVSAWLWRSGATQVASTTAETALLAALTCMAGFTVFGGPARLRRARVPINRAVPPAWWPRETDNVPLLAACLGTPLVFGAGAAVLLFR